MPAERLKNWVFTFLLHHILKKINPNDGDDARCFPMVVAAD